MKPTPQLTIQEFNDLEPETEHGVYLKLGAWLRKTYPILFKMNLFHWNNIHSYRKQDKQSFNAQSIVSKEHALGNLNGYPDLFIAVPVIHQTKNIKLNLPEKITPEMQEMVNNICKGLNTNYSGLYLEIKRIKSPVFKKNGELRKDKSGHLQAQYDTLCSLRKMGYKAEFAVGLKAAKAIISEYLGDPVQYEYLNPLRNDPPLKSQGNGQYDEISPESVEPMTKSFESDEFKQGKRLYGL